MGDPHNKGSTNLGFILRYPSLRKLPYIDFISRITTMLQANVMRRMGSQLYKQQPSRRTDMCQDIVTARMSMLSA